jgi:hypothetical protein
MIYPPELYVSYISPPIADSHQDISPVYRRATLKRGKNGTKWQSFEATDR